MTVPTPRVITHIGRTETTTGHCIFLAKLVISLAQIFIAQDLVGFTDLGSARVLVSS